MPLLETGPVSGGVRIGWVLTVDRHGVWEHLVRAETLPQWLGRLVSGSFDPGAELVVEHDPGHPCRSRVLDRSPGEFLHLTWQLPGEPVSQLDLSLEDRADGCLLVLRHEDLGDLAASYLPGWITHLSYFEGSLTGAPLPGEHFWLLYATFQELTAC
ncbi:SRPBCC domain-containing protein [Arsenicicoccus dermatophilus]|uniref:SRPBCC domain-containing protein n=1 Tax=Arsenicicoccus dermatophilus TaxID=1076331 RepID=UPI00391758AF